MRESYTAVIARNEDWSDEWTTEPYETAWAQEAIFFIRVLSSQGAADCGTARVQISPDGMHWADEGGSVDFRAEGGVSFLRVRNFGGWLRLRGSVAGGGKFRVMAYLTLKG